MRDLGEQARAAAGWACEREPALEAIVPKLRDLGARHVGYGARPEHYPVVGEALNASMAEIAGPAWTPGYEWAWSEAFAIVAGAMIEGAETANLRAAA